MQTNLAETAFPPDLLVELRALTGRTKAVPLTQDLRAAVLSGRLLPGTRLPPSRVLAAELGMSRSVVVRAFTELIADGYLDARQGAGTFVRPEPEDASPGRGDQEPVHPLEAPLLRVPARMRLLGGLPDAQLFPRALWARHYRAALMALPDSELSYPDSRGAEALRCALAAYLGRVRAVRTTPEQVIVCAGVTQGLALVCRALRRAGVQRIVVEDPCFGPHRETIVRAGLEPVPIPVDAGGLDVAQLPVGGVGAALVAPAHSFPTGGTLDGARRHALVAWARRHGVLLVEDDYDAELRYDRTPIAALQGHAPDHVVYLGSASKSFSPALRIGWIAAPARLAGALDVAKRFEDMGSGLLEQHTFARLLERGEFARHLRRVRPVYRRRRDAALAALAQLLPQARPAGAAAGLHLHVRLPAGVDVAAVRRAAYDRGVLIEDAAQHSAVPERAAPAIVLGYGSLPESAIPNAVAILRDALAHAGAR
jgi:GntR family transcriptional regulator / MocR family aminotransferase